jgi:hypothetical protein
MINLGTVPRGFTAFTIVTLCAMQNALSDILARDRLHCLDFMYLRYEWVIVRGSVVVKVLCYKPEGRGFETR